MKNKFIKILANPDKKKDSKVYNELWVEYSPIAGARKVYHYQLGYTPTKLVNLKYEIQKEFGITDKDIALYNPANDVEDVKIQDLAAEEMEAAKKAHQTEAAERLKAQNVSNPILDNIDEPAQQGLKIRDQYPFLNDENTPDEFKILVSDKISAYKKYAAKHAEALGAADQGEAEDKLYEHSK